jgi:AraC-like DNA-binding protein
VSTFVRAERIDQWEGAWASVWAPSSQQARVCAQFACEDEPGFWGELRITDLGAVRVAQATAAPYRLERTPALIRRSDPELLYLAMVRRGRATVDQDGREASVGPSDLVLYDSSRPFHGRSTDDGNTLGALFLMFPRALLPLPASQIGRLTAVRLGPRAGIGSLAARFLTELGTGISHYGQAEAVRLSTTVLELLATRLASELDGDRWITPEMQRRTLMTRIDAFIEDNLGHPDLTPGTIAAAHHISLSFLHRLFQAEGTTVAGTVRRRRLAACRRDLADPALATRSVAAIAARWGFSSGAHFSRVFKTAHGIPPKDYRRNASALAVAAPDAMVRPGHDRDVAQAGLPQPIVSL